MAALTRAEIAEALDEVGAEWNTVYRHHRRDATHLVIEIELDEGR